MQSPYDGLSLPGMEVENSVGEKAVPGMTPGNPLRSQLRFSRLSWIGLEGRRTTTRAVSRPTDALAQAPPLGERSHPRSAGP
jgi:hypothetical protein